MSLTFIIRLVVILLTAFTLVLTAMLSFADQLPLWLKIICTVVPGAFTYLAGNLPSLIETERAQNTLNSIIPRNTLSGNTHLVPTEPNVVVGPNKTTGPDYTDKQLELTQVPVPPPVVSETPDPTTSETVYPPPPPQRTPPIPPATPPQARPPGRFNISS